MSGFDPRQISPTPGNQISPSIGILAEPSSASFSSPVVGLSGKRKRMSKPKGSPVLKRAASTPQMSSLGPDSGALSPSAMDKRRNKLGYQRITIACGHCRRRKIRCVLQESDELGRCHNCIRLKKDCVFYPVDSAGGTESRAQSKSSKPSSVVSNSPCERNPGLITDHEHDLPHFSHLGSNAPAEYRTLEAASGLGISTRATMNNAEYGFNPDLVDRHNWHPGMFSAADMSHAEAPDTSPWRFQESPRMGEFAAGHPTSDGPSASGYPNYPYPHPREEFGMQPPLRSMSYGNIELAMSHFAPPTSHSMDYVRQDPSTHYTLPSHGIRNTPSTLSMPEVNLTPVASEPMPQYGMYASNWSYYNQQSQTTNMDFPRHDSVNVQWYHPSHLHHGLDDQSQAHQPPQSTIPRSPTTDHAKGSG